MQNVQERPASATAPAVSRRNRLWLSTEEDLYNLLCAESESSQEQNCIAMTGTGSAALQGFDSRLQLRAVLVGGDGL